VFIPAALSLNRPGIVFCSCHTGKLKARGIIIQIICSCAPIEVGRASIISASSVPFLLFASQIESACKNLFV